MLALISRFCANGKADRTALVRLLLISNPNVMIELGKGNDRDRDNK